MTVIQPSDIDLHKGLLDTFNHSETEASALWIIYFFQTKARHWAEGFTFDEINNFYHERIEYYVWLKIQQNIRKSPLTKLISLSRLKSLIGDSIDSIRAFEFNRLLNVYVVERDGRFFVTDKFVAKCYASTC